jgi:hypothetical protein
MCVGQDEVVHAARLCTDGFIAVCISFDVLGLFPLEIMKGNRFPFRIATELG